MIILKKCLHCNELCEDDIVICPKCGAMVDTYVEHKKYMDVYHVNHGNRIRNYRLILWFLLGFVLPYVGFLISWILYDSDRDKAKCILFGAITSSLVATLLPYVLFLLVGDKEGSAYNSEANEQIKVLIGMYKGL